MEGETSPQLPDNADAAPVVDADGGDDDNDEALLQQAMGFSSFTDHRSKKRKFNHNTDNVLPSPAHGLPARPPAMASQSQSQSQSQSRSQGRGGGGFRGGRGGGEGRNRGGGEGDDGKPWWEGYYDFGSNENPWEELERAMGLQSKGTWLKTGQRRHQGDVAKKADDGMDEDGGVSLEAE